MLSRRGIKYRIPMKSNAIKRERYSKLKPFRWTVERTISWIHNFRAVKTYLGV
jgi:hypothetical protein